MYTPPVTSLTMSVLGPLNRPSLFDIRLNDATGALFGPAGTVFDGWCLAMNIFLDTSTASFGTVYSGYEPGSLSGANLPIGSGPSALDNLDSINWLINDYNGSNYTWGEVQAAIWALIGDDWTVFAGALGNPDPARVNALAGQALANDGFKPEAGQILGLVLDVRDAAGNQQQPTLIEVRAAELGDRVFEDKNANGIQDAGDQGIAGARIELVRDLNGDGDFGDANEILAVGTTDTNGDYSFKGLTPGVDYQVRFVQPAGYNGASPRQVGGDNAVDSDGLVSSVQVLAPAEYRSTVDSGFYKFAALGDRVWVDGNGNGQQDFGEGGQVGVTVNLINSAGTVIATQTTGAGGTYLFSNLVPGSYSVEFVAPVGQAFTVANTGADATDSDANQGTGRTQVYDLASGETNRTVDAGLVAQAPQRGSLSGTVREDRDNNDSGDVPIGGVTIVLKNAAGTVVGTTTTAPDGTYSFTNLTPGDYTVHQTNLNGYTDVNDVDGGDPNSIAATVPAGGQSTGNDFVDERPASLGDRVWLDANGNGQQDGGEANVAGVTVNLLDAGGSVIDTQITNGTGNYLFTNLEAGTYSVQFVKPAGLNFTSTDTGADASDSDADQTTGRTVNYTLFSGDDNRTVDAGLVQPAPQPGTLSGTVREDRDNNDSGDVPIGGVTIVLKNAAGTVVGTTITAPNGTYSFTNLTPGDYTVHQTNLNGYTDVNDVDGGDPNSISATVPAGGQSTGNDFVDERPASLGDRVWLDANGNGQQDGGEANVAGVTVNLLDAGGSVIDTQITNGTGNYLFTNLEAGTYSVQFVKPAGLNFTSTDTGADASDSDADQTTGQTGPYTLFSGDDNRTVDAGLVQPAPPAKARLGDLVFLDRNANGVQDADDVGISGVQVDLKGATGAVIATTTTDGNGRYFFDVDPGTYAVAFVDPTGHVNTLRDVGDDAADSDASFAFFRGTQPVSQSGNYTVASGDTNLTIDAGYYKKASLGDRVWLDANGNGQQDGGEANVAGVTVNLLNAGGSVVSTQVTNGTGNYLFTNLDPGTYSVQFVKPAGLNFTTADTGADGSDSDADQTTGVTGPYTLLSGDDNRTVDAGLRAPAAKATLGDRVFLDKNANGVQDAGETGISGVTVTLHDTAGNTLNTTTTDGNGNYSFSVDAGTYAVKVAAPNGYLISGKDLGGNDATDSDVDGAGKSGLYTVAAGETNNTIDAGLYQTASIGNRVWSDTNNNGVQDGGELGVGGILVTLRNPDQTQAAQTTTDGNGNYLFSGLKPGDYFVDIDTPNLTFTGSNVGADDSIDSDVIPGASGWMAVTTLESGEVDLTWDAGIAAAQNKICTTVNLQGNTALDGTDGNTRSWTDATTGVTVTARAFSQAKGSSTFETAYLGAYSGGLGVTDRYEGNGDNNRHTVDNVDKNNYIVFQFSQAVDVSKVSLGYVSGDSDIQVWVANSNTTLTSLTSTTLSGAAFTELNMTSSTGARVADVNAGDVMGNIFIVAADTTDTTPEDFFKLSHIDFCVLTNNPAPAKGSIGDRVWEDKNFNGVQDGGEVGLSGVTVKLLNSAGTVVATTTTNGSGNYVFNNLDAGNYKVHVTPQAGYHVTKQDQGGNDTNDSDINSSGVTGTIALAAGQNITTVDAGLYRKASIGDKVFADWDHDGYQDAGEGAVKNVKVLLQNSAGQTIATTYTDSSGNYKFTNLDPGSYRIGFDKYYGVHVADGKSVRTWSWAKVNVGTDDTRDSDATAAYNAIAYTTYTTLDSGEYDNTWDVGVTPIVIDLDGNGIQTIARSNAGGSFDLFGTGNAVASGWISATDGFLAVDANGNGSIDSSAELFGGSGKGAGYAKLGSYDSNGDGMVSMLDSDFAQLLIWQDANGNHQTDAGELMTLAEAGVTSLGLSLADQNFYADSEGNVHGETSSATLANGQTVTMTDVYFSVDKSDALAAGAALPTIGELLGTGEHDLDALVGSCAPAGASSQQFDDSCAEAGELLRKLSAMSRADLEQQASLAH